MIKLRIDLEFYHQYVLPIDGFLKDIKAKIKMGRQYLNFEFKRENLARYMDKHDVFMGGGASDQYTADCALIERCLEKILGFPTIKRKGFLGLFKEIERFPNDAIV